MHKAHSQRFKRTVEERVEVLIAVKVAPGVLTARAVFLGREPCLSEDEG